MYFKLHSLFHGLIVVLIFATGFSSLLKNANAYTDLGYMSSFGSIGTAELQFNGLNSLNGIAKDSSGNIYVGDLGNNRVQILHPDGTFYKMFGWGVATGANAFEICTSGCQAGINGGGNGQFLNGYDYSTMSIAVDSNGFIYVNNGINGFGIQEFDSNLNFITRFTITDINGEDHRFIKPSGLAIDSSNNLYIADSGNYRIQEFASNGNFVKMFGWGVQDGTHAFQVCTSLCVQGGLLNGSGDGQFNNPNFSNSIAFDSSGNIYVSDYGNNRVQIFHPDGTFYKMFGWGVQDGTPAYQICTSGCQAGINGGGTEDGNIYSPISVAIDSNDNIYVSGGGGITKFDSNLNFLMRAHLVSAPFYGSFTALHLLVDASNNLFLSEAQNGGIFKFTPDVKVPEISSVSVGGAPLVVKYLGDPDVTVDIYGTDFNPDAVVNFNGVPHTPITVTSSHLTVTLTSADFSNLGTFPITVENPTPVSEVSGEYFFINVINGTTYAVASLVMGNTFPFPINDTAGEADAVYDFSYTGTNTGTLHTLTVTFPAGYTITNGSLTSGIISYYCTNSAAAVCFNNNQSNISASGDSINRTITITFNSPIDITNPFNISFTVTSGIQNPISANLVNGSEFTFQDDLAGNSPVHSISDVTILPALLDHFSINPITNNYTNSTFDISLLAKDIYNNTVTDFLETVDVTSSGALSTGSGTTANFVGGLLNHSVKFSNSGTFTITATKTGSTETGVSNSFNITTPSSSRGGSYNPPPPPNPCIANPGLPQCPNHCLFNPTLSDCHVVDPCTLNPSLCIVPPPHNPPPTDSSNNSTSNNSSSSKSGTITPPPTKPTVTPPIQVQTPKPTPISPIKTFLKTVAAKIILVTVASTALATTMASTPMSMWRSMLSFLAVRKRKPWGVVYDSITKQPLDPAYVVLQDINGTEINTAITDLDGRYGFFLNPGMYKLIANKTNYIFPSAKLQGKFSDELYDNLYFGDIINILKAGDVLAKNIPMDPMNFDWNEYAKKQQNLLHFYQKRDILLNKVSSTLFYFGFILSSYAILNIVDKLNISIFILYIIIFFFRTTLLKPKQEGTVTDRDGSPLAFAIVRIFSASTHTEMLHKTTNALGKYYCLISNGHYYVKIEKHNSDDTYTLVYTSGEFEVREGVVNGEFKI